VALVSYRYFHSFRDFQGDEEVEIPFVKNDTYVDIFDLSVAYAVSKRVSVSLELPFQYGSRTNAFEHDLVHVRTTRAAGMGDMRVAGNVWVLDPDKHSDYNVSLSLGLKIPTGQDDITDDFLRPDGRSVERPVDLSIQPGDGSWGIIFATNAFARLHKSTFAFFQATYLSNPREFNGVQTSYGDEPDFTLGDKGAKFNSVPDQWLVRSGVTTALWREKGLSGSLAVRWEGIPIHDLIGGSDGYRLPGYSVSIEPGLSISRGRDSLAVSVPVAIYRKGLRAIPDVRLKSPFAGIASFADFQINVTYSHLF
jgi:hypothetical protein